MGYAETLKQNPYFGMRPELAAQRHAKVLRGLDTLRGQMAQHQQRGEVIRLQGILHGTGAQDEWIMRHAEISNAIEQAEHQSAYYQYVMWELVSQLGWDAYEAIANYYPISSETKLSDIWFARDRVLATGGFEVAYGHRRYMITCRQFVVVGRGGETSHIVGFCDEENTLFVEKV